MEEVEREDGELCGFVERRADGWHAMTVFGATLAVCTTQDEAESRVRHGGLGALAERWTLTIGAHGGDQLVCIQEASPSEVTVALGYYSLPGVPTMTVTRQQLDAGDVGLRLPRAT